MTQQYICPYCKKSILIEEIKNNFNICLNCNRDLSTAKELNPLRNEKFKKEFNLQNWNNVNKAGSLFFISFSIRMIYDIIIFNNPLFFSGLEPVVQLVLVLTPTIIMLIGCGYMFGYIEK